MRLEQRRHDEASQSGNAWRASSASPFVAMTIGNAITCAACAPSMFGVLRSTTVTPVASWAVIIFLGAVQIGAAYWLYGAAVGKLPALRSTLLATIEPILNPLWVALVRGERPTRWAAVGGAVIVASVTLQAVTRRDYRRAS
jgi:drug/metabolite transporter (DMT)-like permease